MNWPWREAIWRASRHDGTKGLRHCRLEKLGKTGLAVRIVSELTARGYRVSTIKHAHHDFDIDKVGADSWRHRQAGAHEVTIVSGTRFAIMHELRGEPEPSFEEILSRLAPCDLVLIEGYKYERCRRSRRAGWRRRKPNRLRPPIRISSRLPPTTR